MMRMNDAISGVKKITPGIILLDLWKIGDKKEDVFKQKVGDNQGKQDLSSSKIYFRRSGGVNSLLLSSNRFLCSYAC